MRSSSNLCFVDHHLVHPDGYNFLPALKEGASAFARDSSIGPTMAASQPHYMEIGKPLSFCVMPFPGNNTILPKAGRNFPSQVVWSDTHLLAGISMSAGPFGVPKEPEDACRFACREEIPFSIGFRGILSRPPDFLVVADHSDNM